VHGAAAIGGGIWLPPQIQTFGADAPRIYDSTGYRDYMLSAQRTLVSWLSANAYPASRLFLRETDAEHELYAWEYSELFRWLDRGERPEPGTLSNGWTMQQRAPGESLLHLSVGPDGVMLASAADGRFFARARADTGWNETAHLVDSFAPAFADFCLFASNAGL